MISQETVSAVVAAALTDCSLELVELQLVPGRRQLIRVFIDSPPGVSVGECAEVSRAIARRLDAELPQADNYVLEVSSPGMNRPVRTLEHFRRFQGEAVRFELKESRDGQASFEGHIESVQGDCVSLRTRDGQLLEVTVDAIRSAHLDLDPWKGRRGQRS